MDIFIRERTPYNRILNEASEEAGITENIGTHTLRKTFGYWAYRQGTDIVMVMQLLNHSAPVDYKKIYWDNTG